MSALSFEVEPFVSNFIAMVDFLGSLMENFLFREKCLRNQPYETGCSEKLILNDFSIEIKCNHYFIPYLNDKVVLGNLKPEPGEDHLGDEFNIFSRWDRSKHRQLVGTFGYFWLGKVQPIKGNATKPASWLAFQVMFTLYSLRLAR